MSETLAERDDAPAQASDLSWVRSYDRASVERFLADAAAKRAELQEQLAAAQARVERARQALEQRDEADSAALAAMVAEAHRQIAALEADHEAAVAAVSQAALDEAGRLRAGIDRPPPAQDGEPT